MYRYILVALLSLLLAGNAYSQDRKAKAGEITNKLSFMKKGCDKRQIVFRDDSIYGTPFTNVIMKKNIDKDSLRHLLVDNGFYDFNFEQFEFKIKDLSELNERFIKRGTPQLSKLLSDSTYSKITYSFQESKEGITISALCSENVINVDDEKEGYFAIGAGYVEETITVKGSSKKKDIVYCEEDSFARTINNAKNQRKEIMLDNKGRFKITVDVTSHSRKYVGIKDANGRIFSLIKIY